MTKIGGKQAKKFLTWLVFDDDVDSEQKESPDSDSKSETSGDVGAECCFSLDESDKLSFLSWVLGVDCGVF